MIIVLFSTTPREDLHVEAYRRTSARMRELVAAMPNWVQVCRTLREYRFVTRDYVPDLASMFAAGSAIRGRRAPEGPCHE